MASPLVTIICLCYNHEKYISEAVESIINQTYKNLEIVIIDNGSPDNSREIIKSIATENPDIKMIMLRENIGNCRAFNLGLAESKGEFIIDLSGDDILLPDRIKEGLKSFAENGEEYGVNYTDALYIDDSGHVIGQHYKRDPKGLLLDTVPEGKVYSDLLARYFICTPTMMMRKSVLDQLGGYDENLKYEDFDFWIRSAKITKYCYTDKALVKKRVLKDSLSSGQYKRNSNMISSTYQVCLKAEKLNETESEAIALCQRSTYEFRKALFSGNFTDACKFSSLLIRNLKPGPQRSLYILMNNILRLWS
jgi:glycosyltransferase involved in cell wall biosynthesis